MKKILILLICLLLIPLATAKYISIIPTVPPVIILEDSTNLEVILKQNGDEAAYEVEVVPLVPESFSAKGSLNSQRFDPGKTLKGNFTLSVEEEISEGKYPFVVQIIYHDANMYPFSTVYSRLVTYKTASSSKVYGSFKSLEIEKEGSEEFLLNVRNLDDISHDVAVNIYLPRELKSDKQEETISIGAKEEKEIKYKISSFGALPDSSYSVLASLEYENGLHYTAFATGIIKIVEKKENPNLLLGLIALFTILLLVFVFYKIKTRKKKVEE